MTAPRPRTPHDGWQRRGKSDKPSGASVSFGRPAAGRRTRSGDLRPARVGRPAASGGQETCGRRGMSSAKARGPPRQARWRRRRVGQEPQVMERGLVPELFAVPVDRWIRFHLNITVHFGLTRQSYIFLRIA